jgi:hypothetical protein
VNLATGEGRGLQMAGTANGVRGNMKGLQMAGAVNVVDGDMRGLQMAGAVNLARGFRGLQMAGAASVAEQVDGMQMAPVNVAEDVRGFQLGVVNVSGVAKGFRLGVVNVARESHGFQLGVVNVAQRDDGESFALLSLIGNGIHDVAAYATDTMLSNVAVKLGGRHLYSSLILGFTPGDDLPAGTEKFERGTRRIGIGFGIGWRAPIGVGRFEALEIEASSMNMHSDFSSGWDSPPTVSSLRVAALVNLAPHIRLLAGAGANVSVAEDGRDADFNLGLPEYVGHSGGTTVRVYPGFILGLQI